MSSITSTVILLIVLSSLESPVRPDLKQSVCEDKTTYIDSIINFKDYRYFVINAKFFEYDYKYNFRRRGVLDYEIYEYERNDQTNTKQYSKVPVSKFLTGFFIPEIDCKKVSEDIKHNCTVISDHFSNVEVVVIYDAFFNKYQTISKRLDSNDNLYFGLQGCTDPLTKSTGATDTTDTTDTTDSMYENELNDSTARRNAVNSNQSSKYCGPYKMEGRGSPNDWLLKGLAYNKRHKFLPIFYDSTRLELIVVLNKEYEMFGQYPSLIREHARVYWKSIKYKDPEFGWQVKSLPDEYTYTAFLEDGQKVYLIGEPFQDKREALRGPSAMFPFDIDKKQVMIEKTNRNPLDLFDCSLQSSNLLGYIIISILAVILILVICGWIFACYWFYGKEGKTTYTTSVKMENT